MSFNCFPNYHLNFNYHYNQDFNYHNYLNLYIFYFKIKVDLYFFNLAFLNFILNIVIAINNHHHH